MTLRNLSVQNFKCFASLELPLNDLTLLTGVNSAGKSSAVQALLALRQSADQGLLLRGRLALNGDLVTLGTAKDALFQDAEDEVITLGLHDSEGRKASWAFRYESDRDVLAAAATEYSPAHSPELFGVGWFVYLSAERIGPRTSYARSDFAVRERRQLGRMGEYALDYLARFADHKVADGLRHPKAVSAQLKDQVEAWTGEITPGTRIHVRADPSMDAVKLRYSFELGNEVTDEFRATNVGFGLSYTLPVLVALLGASPGDILVIENPEAHLHPRGQAQMGRMLALAAAAGIQVIIETHSDHVLNGVRLAVASKEIEPEQVAVHFFAREQADGAWGAPYLVSPTIDGDGRIDRWPEGFFDEWDKALDRLLAGRVP